MGTDFRAAVGELVRTANTGKVVLAKNLFYTGNTVIVDHGVGLFTLYGHLSHITVQKGDEVGQLEIVGLAGQTGRVTGPHLHWGVKSQGHWVDGFSLVDVSKQVLTEE